MRKADIQEGAAVYYVAADGPWKHLNPTKAVIVDPQPRRIVRTRQGPFYFVSHRPDPKGTAVLVDLHENRGVRREAVYVRHLRGLWKPTLAKLGKAEADVKAYDALISHIASQPGDITGADLLRLAAADPHIDHDTLTVLADAIDPKEQ
ncbi:hypothetical protein ACVCAH_11525 [Micromonospora sp. LZ34]